ncbi:helix-turn-helix domain-containing protein [Porticoccaceae bacterium]|nr:helix-turn-helix domain-containing protein [Porticoccaceae bacterium]
MTQNIRVQNLRELIAEFGSQAKLADAVGCTASVISQLVTGHRDVGEKLARKIEKGASKPPLWLDSLQHSGVAEPLALYQGSVSLKELWESTSEEERAEFLRDLASKR